MPFEETKILGFLQYQKSDKTPCIVHADLECIIEKIDGCENNPQKLSTTKVSKHNPSAFEMSTISSFRSMESKHNVYRGKCCMKNVCESLREHSRENINFFKKVINKTAGII